MMGAKKVEDPPPMGAPMWVVTFTDMISLLLTFFILLLTFSSMEEEKFSLATGSLAGAFGVISPTTANTKRDLDDQTARNNRKADARGTLDPSFRNDPAEETIARIQNREIFDVQVDGRDTSEGTRLRLEPKDGAELFELGTAQLTARGREVLAEIAVQFRTHPCRLVIETHVDSLTWQASAEGDALRLTERQGFAAARVFESQGIAPERIGLSPQGASRPIAPNDTPNNRRRNRFVEVLVIPYRLDPLFREMVTKGS